MIAPVFRQVSRSVEKSPNKSRFPEPNASPLNPYPAFLSMKVVDPGVCPGVKTTSSDLPPQSIVSRLSVP
jgi:hypothetical protein